MNTIKSIFFRMIIRKETTLLFVFLIAGITLFGWLLNNITLTSFSSRYKPISPIVAMTFIAISILVFLRTNFAIPRFAKNILVFLLTIFTLYYILTLLGYIFNLPVNTENILVKNLDRFGITLTGFMSPIASVLFVLICISILLFRENKSTTINYIGGSLSLLVGIISFILLIGYLYNAPFLYGSKIIPVALPASICFFLFSIIMLRIYEMRFWTFNLIKDNRITLHLLKSFLPIVIIIIILEGFLDNALAVNNINPPLISATILLIAVSITIYIIISVSTNIGSQLTRAELALKESEKQLIRLNADKDLFISILGHDLRSPFNNLLGLSELLTEEVSKLNNAEIENYVNNISKTAQNTFNLLESILIWTNAQSGRIPFKPQNLSLTDICKDVLETLNHNANAKNITIDFSTTDHINVFADIDMLKTVLRNLVSNAIKFTNTGGTIIISCEKADFKTIISVLDNGIGIKPDNLTKLFEISQRLTTTGTLEETGTGMGLLLCKEFVEKHGGEIWVESEAGRGSEFYFSLPDRDEYNDINAVENSIRGDKEDSGIRNLKILITDDDEQSRFLLAKIIGIFGKEILYAKTGIEAVVACKENPDIEFVLMDIKMPDMDGFEATRQIRLSNKEVIIIAQTAYANSSEKVESEEAGCNDIIYKPINKTILKELIIKHCNKSKMNDNSRRRI